MPEYGYKCDACEATAVLVRRVDQRNRTFLCPACPSGRMRRSVILDMLDAPPAVPAPAGCWPQESYAAGVQPQQVAEARRRFPRHEFNPKTGAMVFQSAAHRRKCLKDIGMRDLNSYYD